ncbi:hypothetical protein ACFL6I_04145 [candidate division KSB1 bacterium]
MNIYAIIVLTALLFDFVLDSLSELLNLRALSTVLPGEFEDVYDAEKYKKSQEYTRVRTKFGFVTGTFGLCLMLVFWFAGGFRILDQLIRGWGFHEIWNGLLFTRRSSFLGRLKNKLNRTRQFIPHG